MQTTLVIAQQLLVIFLHHIANTKIILIIGGQRLWLRLRLNKRGRARNAEKSRSTPLGALTLGVTAMAISKTALHVLAFIAHDQISII
jgi:hypothetical protein